MAVDWTKAIETISGEEARLVFVDRLTAGIITHLIVFKDIHGWDSAWVTQKGCTAKGILVRNVESARNAEAGKTLRV